MYPVILNRVHDDFLIVRLAKGRYPKYGPGYVVRGVRNVPKAEAGLANKEFPFASDLYTALRDLGIGHRKIYPI